MPAPTIGRIVLYHHTTDGVDYPALVIATPAAPEPDDVTLALLRIFRKGNVTEERWAVEGDLPGQWAWPERTE